MGGDDFGGGLWILVVINSVIFIVFAASFFHPQTGRDWRVMGAYSAFIVALFAEMYDLVSDAIIWVALSALAGGRVLYVFQNELGMVALEPLHALMVWQGGLSFYGGLIGALIALAVFARRRGVPILATFDVAAPGAAIGQAIGHLGCLIGGDSYGLSTDLPWAVIYRNPGAMAPQNISLHPTQAYEAILLAGLFAGLWLGRERLLRLGVGVAAGAYLLGLAAIRFGLFFLRDEPPVLLGLKTAQWTGLGIAVLAVVLVIVARRRARPIQRRSIQR